MSVTPSTAPIPPLARPLKVLRGIGSEREAQLARLELFTVEDLLLHRPRRYEDRRHFRSIAEMQLDEAGTTRGKIVALGLKRFRGGQKSVFEIILEDGTARLHCRWWNLPFMENYFAMGDEVFVFGKLKSIKPRTIDHPETEVIEGGEESSIHINRIAPIYPLTEGLPQRWLRSLIWRTLNQFEPELREPWPKLTLANFPPRANAIRMMHFPEALEDIELARRRLALDEFIELQRDIQTRRKRFEAKAHGLPCGGNNRLIKPFLARLGFSLTVAQTRVLRELRHDMAGAHPMRRLLQGDVGSGKTAVAACCALMALESGYDVALMAPTEILAEQHFQTFKQWFEPLDIDVQLRTGSHKGEARMDATNKAASPRLTIGTHALIEAGFTMDRLGLVIIDEQHKFGVTQREQLVRKGSYPHLLVMTATPIPRTLGLTLYGELDVSVIDELPAGRGRIKTFVRPADKLPKVWAFIREKLAEGRQAYVVYPRVEEAGINGLKAVTKEFENLKVLLAPYKIGLLHGRLRSAEKEMVMTAFRANTVNVLLATPLIEVGVDVPNATVMLIENAEQFGLAQLHQLRGRIGRGAHDSYCILVASAKSREARQRLKVLEETTDGFRIAEADLKLRGPGELLGQQQSGLPKFRFGNLVEDLELIKLARQLAAEV
ncbi:MAG: box helicase domain protein [Pedosphaera sp.]|nr:box helicase domain protein [Pedosphaera sp.]